MAEQPKLTYSDALKAVTDTIHRANPGQTIVVDRGHIDRDGTYFTVTLTTRDRLREQVEAEVRGRLRDLEMELKALCDPRHDPAAFNAYNHAWGLLRGFLDTTLGEQPEDGEGR